MARRVRAGSQILLPAEPHSCVAFLPVGVRIRRNAAKPVPYAENLNTLGRHLLKERTLRSVHQREAAEVIGVNAWTYANWETGRTSPMIRFWPAIIDFLGHQPVLADDDAWRATA